MSLSKADKIVAVSIIERIKSTVWETINNDEHGHGETLIRTEDHPLYDVTILANALKCIIMDRDLPEEDEQTLWHLVKEYLEDATSFVVGGE